MKTMAKRTLFWPLAQFQIGSLVPEDQNLLKAHLLAINFISYQ